MTNNLKEIKKLSFPEIKAIVSDSETESKTLLQIMRVCLEKSTDEYIDEEGEDEIFAEIALNHNATADILRLLSSYDNWLVRRNIAYNINATADILEKLAKDEEEFVQLAVAENDKTPSESLGFLSDFDNEEIRIAVAHNSNTNSHTLYKMASNSAENCGLVFEEIALNANSDTETLSLLAEDEYRYIHKGISKTQTEAIYEAIKNNKKSSPGAVQTAEKYLNESEKTRFNEYFL